MQYRKLLRALRADADRGPRAGPGPAHRRPGRASRRPGSDRRSARSSAAAGSPTSAASRRRPRPPRPGAIDRWPCSSTPDGRARLAREPPVSLDVRDRAPSWPAARPGTRPARRAVAQLVEHRSPKPAVGGSSPSCPALRPPRRPRRPEVDHPSRCPHGNEPRTEAHAAEAGRGRRRRGARRDPRAPPAGAEAGQGERTPAAQFLQEVRAELRKVVLAHPAGDDQLLAVIVLVAIVVLTTLHLRLDCVFGDVIDASPQHDRRAALRRRRCGPCTTRIESRAHADEHRPTSRRRRPTRRAAPPPRSTSRPTSRRPRSTRPTTPRRRSPTRLPSPTPPRPRPRPRSDSRPRRARGARRGRAARGGRRTEGREPLRPSRPLVRASTRSRATRRRSSRTSRPASRP